MNKLCEHLLLDYPIFQGGMGNVSHAQLTAAISEAGALGTIGAGTKRPDEIEEMVKDVKSRTSKPFALNIPISVQPYLKEVIPIVFKHDIPIVSLSAGNPSPFIEAFQANGTKVICVVASVNQALKAEYAGADVVVAEGFEAAGINSNYETTTLTLVPQIVDAVSIPVVAAGGIADGRGLLAMLALGAQGVQMGTRFIATQEAMVHDHYKRFILEADDRATIVVGRTVGRARRLLKTEYAMKLQELEQKGLTLEQFNYYTDEAHHVAGALAGELAEGHLNGGQIAGLIQDIPTVASLLKKIMADASSIYQALGSTLAYIEKQTVDKA